MEKGRILQYSNLFMLLLLFFTLILGYLLRVEFSPVWLAKFSKIEPTRIAILNTEAHVQQAESSPVNKIYSHENIFDIQAEQNQDWSKSPVSLSIPEMVDLKYPEKKPTPKTQPTVAIIDPLNISISGVIISDNFYQNSCMITDSSGKEKLFKVGQKIEDSIITSISKNAVCLIRPNGQVEHFALSAKTLGSDDKVFARVIDEKTVTLDFRKMLPNISSIGEMLQELAIVAHWVDGVCVGFSINATGPIVEQLGLKEKDVLISVADHSVIEAENRINAYKKLIELKYGDSFSIVVKRGESELTIVYNLERLDNSTKKSATSGKTEIEPVGQEPAKEKENKEELSAGIEPEKTEKKEVPSLYFPAETIDEYNENIRKIRARLLEKIGSSRISS